MDVLHLQEHIHRAKRAPKSLWNDIRILYSVEHLIEVTRQIVMELFMA